MKVELVPLIALIVALLALALWVVVFLLGRAGLARDAAHLVQLARLGGCDAAVATLAGRSRGERGRVLALAARGLATMSGSAEQEEEEDDDDEGEGDWDLDGEAAAEETEEEEPYEEDEEDEEPELDRDGQLALQLVGRALDAAPDDPQTLVTSARVLLDLARFDDLEDVLARAVTTAGLGADAMTELARVGIDAEAFPGALACAERGLRQRDGDLVLVGLRAEALLALDRPGEAAPSLEAALGTIHVHAGRIEGVRVDWEQVEQWLVSLHDEAVRRSTSAEKVIDGHVAAGRLDPRAGANYKLMAHSLLVESTAKARRLLVPTQDELRAAVDRERPGVTWGHEDDGLLRLREGDLAGAVAAFRAALEVAPSCWPALAGLGAALELHEDPPWRGLPGGPSSPALAGLVLPWAALTPVERDLVALAVAPFAARLPDLVAAGARLHVVALDAKLTDLEVFRGAQGVIVEDEDDRRTHDAIDGMANGLVAGIKIEALYERSAEQWVLAHELGHVLHASLDDEVCARVEVLYAAARKVAWRSTEYGLRNPFEFFATGYERFALRRAFREAARGEVHEADVDLGVDAFFRELLAT